MTIKTIIAVSIFFTMFFATASFAMMGGGHTRYIFLLNSTFKIRMLSW